MPEHSFPLNNPDVHAASIAFLLLEDIARPSLTQYRRRDRPHRLRKLSKPSASELPHPPVTCPSLPFNQFLITHTASKGRRFKRLEGELHADCTFAVESVAVMGVQDVLSRKTGVIVGDDVLALFKYAQEKKFAIPAIVSRPVHAIAPRLTRAERDLILDRRRCARSCP